MLDSSGGFPKASEREHEQRQSVSARVTSIVNQFLSFQWEQNKSGAAPSKGSVFSGWGVSDLGSLSVSPGKCDIVSSFQNQKGDRMRAKETW